MRSKKMPIPDYQAIMLPLLNLSGDRKEHPLREAIDTLADTFSLSDTERKELLPSGQEAIFTNRVAWARTDLKQAGLIEATRRRFFRISDRGLGVFQIRPVSIDVKFLEQFSEFLEFPNRRKDKDEIAEKEVFVS
jgi:restriction system protein